MFIIAFIKFFMTTICSKKNVGLKFTLCLLILLGALPNLGCKPQLHTYNDTRFLMDTTIYIDAAGDDTPLVKSSVDQAFSIFQAIADETNKYEDQSNLGLFNLNHRASLESGKTLDFSPAIPVGEHLFKLVEFAQKHPNPAFDITLGPVIELWREHTPAKTLPTKEELAAALARTGRDRILLNSNAQTISLQYGTILDLGGIAKGYAVDQAADHLAKDANVTTALVNAGGNIKVVGTKANGNPWRIAIQNPRKTDEYMGVIKLHAGEAVATSGDYQRYYEVDGIRYHHLLEPSTGMPARNAASVSVVAKSAMLADYYSTLLFVLPTAATKKIIDATPDIGVIIVDTQGQLYISSNMENRFEKMEK